jgi:GntR family transcriptional regulator/MocR family aminotransferase
LYYWLHWDAKEGERLVLDRSWPGQYGERIVWSGFGAGAHVALWPAARVSETDVIAAAAKLSVAVYGISRYFLSAPRKGFMLGYSRMKESDIREGVRRLSQVL